MDPIETVEEQRARLEREAAARARREQRDEMLRRAHAPLVGTARDLGQGDLFAPDLFGRAEIAPPGNPEDPLARLVGERHALTLRETCGGSLRGLYALPEPALRAAGLPPAAAGRLHAALEIGRRALLEPDADRRPLDTPERAAAHFRPHFLPYPDREALVVCYLDTRFQPRHTAVEAVGGLNETTVDKRVVLGTALRLGLGSVVLAHNHPSGDPTPSEADIRVTRDLLRAAQQVQIKVLDHIILGTATPQRPRDHVSLRELGHFYTS